MKSLKSLAAVGLLLVTAFTATVSDTNAQTPRLSTASAQASAQTSNLMFAEPGQIAQFLQSRGFAVQTLTDNQGDPMLSTRTQGVAYNIFFYGCQNGRNCGAITFESTYDAHERFTLELANSWQLNKRFAYSVIRNDGVLALRMDIPMLGGVNPELWNAAHSLWESQLGDFLRHIRY